MDRKLPPTTVPSKESLMVVIFAFGLLTPASVDRDSPVLAIVIMLAGLIAAITAGRVHFITRPAPDAEPMPPVLTSWLDERSRAGEPTSASPQTFLSDYD